MKTLTYFLERLDKSRKVKPEEAVWNLIKVDHYLDPDLCKIENGIFSYTRTGCSLSNEILDYLKDIVSTINSDTWDSYLLLGSYDADTYVELKDITISHKNIGKIYIRCSLDNCILKTLRDVHFDSYYGTPVKVENCDFTDVKGYIYVNNQSIDIDDPDSYKGFARLTSCKFDKNEKYIYMIVKEPNESATLFKKYGSKLKGKKKTDEQYRDNLFEWIGVDAIRVTKDDWERSSAKELVIWKKGKEPKLSYSGQYSTVGKYNYIMI